jgi:hypothetical protein
MATADGGTWARWAGLTQLGAWTSGSQAKEGKMKARQAWAWSLVLLLVVAGLGGPARAASPESQGAWVDPALRDALGQGPARFWVLLRRQADLVALAPSQNWNERGRAVVGALQGVAEATQAAVRAWLEAQGTTYQAFWIVNALWVAGDAALAEELAARPEVAALHAEREITLPPDVATSTRLADWNIEQIHAPQVWDEFGVTGEGVVVANIDTGVDYLHPSLVGAYRGNLGGGTFDHNYNWWDAVNGLLEPYDDNGHGTATMSVVISAPDTGVAPGAQWMACKAISGGGAANPVDLLECAEWILAPWDLTGQNADPDQRPHIVLNPWNGVGDDPWFDAAIQAWNAAGILSVFPGGAAGPACATMGSPGDSALTTAITATDPNDQVTSFSSRGPGRYGVIKPDLVAPGVDIRVAEPGGGYTFYSGVSFAAGHVAGTAALVISGCPALAGDIEGTRQVLFGGALPLVDMQCGGDPSGVPNNVYGWGRVDAYDAVSACVSLPAMHVHKIQLKYEARSLDRYWVMARAKVVDENNVPMPGVQVTAEWQYPHGRLRQQAAPTTPRSTIQKPTTKPATCCWCPRPPSGAADPKIARVIPRR